MLLASQALAQQQALYAAQQTQTQQRQYPPQHQPHQPHQQQPHQQQQPFPPAAPGVPLQAGALVEHAPQALQQLPAGAAPQASAPADVGPLPLLLPVTDAPGTQNIAAQSPLQHGSHPDLSQMLGAPALPAGYDPNRAPSEDLLALFLHACPDDLCPLSRLLAQRFAAFGIATARLFQYTPGNELFQYLVLHSSSNSHSDNFSPDLCSPAARSLTHSTWCFSQKPPDSLGPHSDRTSARGLARALRDRNRFRDPDVANSSDSDTDDEFDLAGRLSAVGMTEFSRPEHVPSKRCAKLLKQANKALDRNIPWLAPSSKDVLKHWIPAPSAHWGLTEEAGEKNLDKKEFSSSMHLIRHRLTWLYTHVALGAIESWAASYYVAELLELGTAYGLGFLIKYDRTKISRILEDMEIRASGRTASRPNSDISTPIASRRCGPFSSRAEAVLWTSQRLCRPEDALIRDIKQPIESTFASRQDRPRGGGTPKGGGRGMKRDAPSTPDRRPGNAPGQTPAGGRAPRDRLRSRSKNRNSGRDAQRPAERKVICFHQDSRSNLKCPDMATCRNVHLDTSIPAEASRYDRAKAAHERASAGRPR